MQFPTITESDDWAVPSTAGSVEVSTSKETGKEAEW